MDEVLLEILKNNTKVIIPEFGAFIVKQRNPLQVVFNEFLTFNDGILINVISGKYNISKEEAKEKINEWIDQAKSEIEKNNRFEIKGLGFLKKLETGKIHLEVINIKQNEENKTDDHKNKELLDNKKESFISTEEVNSTLSAYNKGEDIFTKKETSLQDKESKIKLSKGDNEINKFIPPIEKTVKFKEPLINETSYKEATTYKNETKKVENINVSMSNKKKINKTAKIIKWLFFIIILNLILVLIFIYSENIIDFYNKKFPLIKQKVTSLFKENTESGKKVEIEKDVTNLQNIKQENTSTTEATFPSSSSENVGIDESIRKEEKTTSYKTDQIKDIRKYFIVAGCFREESNADAYVIMLRNKGYPAEKFGKIGDLTAVSYASFNSKEEALEMLNKIREKESKDAWIFHY